MPLWGNTDAIGSVPLYANTSVWTSNSNIEASNVRLGSALGGLYGNTTPSTFVIGQSVGVFGVSTEEMALSTSNTAPVAHAGWVIRREGYGGRAGRIQTETLVAMSSLTSDGPDDATYRDS